MERKKFLKLLGVGGVGSLGTAGFWETSGKTMKPPRLNKGDTIGLISPASRLDNLERYDQIVQKIQQMGFAVKEGSHARDSYGYLAGRDADRAADLNAMFADEQVKAIIPFRGGWGSNRILNHINFDSIKNNPKILVGFSDITSLLLAIYAKTNLITFHGPVGKSDWTDYTTDHFDNMLTGQPGNTLTIPQNKSCSGCTPFIQITPGRAEGRLLGGNLSVLTAMMGSDYLPEWQGNILFLEDVGEDIYRIDRMLTELKLAGILDQISGFVFGQCTNCSRSDEQSLSLQQVFSDHIKPLGIPAFSGAQFGHVSDMITLPIGLKAQIDAREGTIRCRESAVSI
ncbi:muramoyltetrapeptide carboxypeptidase [Fodinibius salinus]|uniref:Muramoyltetrapeptide carboxypeptidase n=1 Tax=Fodinibius salinus TaxID=860790 RepID=A0A5D3YM40_9BACT|nr:LD-carboxypeptidase [Fodinibius salinus]TYP95216.1 muramoyltetrapeptide carboxypeptidase [Fodinibius salinus]